MKSKVTLSDSEMVAEIVKQIETAHKDKTKNLKKLPALYRKLDKYKGKVDRAKRLK